MKNIRLKIERAKQHLRELQIKLKSFHEEKPYTISVRRDKETKRPTYFISGAKDIPNDVPLIIGEVIQNLRSALDYLAYYLFKKNSTEEGKHVYFPISDDVKKYTEEKERRTDGISQQDKDLIDFFTPYNGGNNILWQIHKLNNIDKHRLLVTAGASFGALDIGAVMNRFMKKSFPNQAKDFPDLPQMFLNPADKLFPLRVGDELFVDEPNALEIPNMQFRIDFLLNESGVVEGQDIVGLLQSMVKEVERVVLAFGD